MANMACEIWTMVGLAALGSASLSCSRSKPPSVEHVPAQPEYSVVWGDTPLGVRSYLLEFSEGRLRVAGESSGAWFLVNGQLYRWHQWQEAAQVLKECPEQNAAPEDDQAVDAAPDDNHSEITVVGAEAERLDASGKVPISPPPSVENATVFDNDISLYGSAGPYLFVDSASSAQYCGAAHDSSTASRDTFDLVSQKFVTVPTKAELAELAALAQQTQRDSLLNCIGARVGPDGRQLGLEELAQLEPWSAVPVLDSSGRLAFEVVLGMMRSYVEGVIECPVTVQAASAPLARFAPPRGLDAFRERQSTTALRGWSSLAPNELASVAKLQRVFAEQARDAEK